MAKTIGQLVNQAVEIRDERDTGDNTATRVGEMFIAIIEHLRDVSDVNSSGNGNNSSISLTGLLSSLSAMTDPENASTNYPNGAVLKYSGGAWGYDNYGGGTTTTTGGGLTVAQLWTELGNPTTQYASGKKIPSQYLDLDDCIPTDATFWGNTINNNVVNGSLAGNISYIKFDYNGHTVYLGLDNDGNLRVSSDNSSGTANFYATGGVSALGNGSSGSGGNSSSSSSSSNTGLNSNILISINGFTASGVTNPSVGDFIYYDSTGWKYKQLNLEDLGNVDIITSGTGALNQNETHVLTYDYTRGVWKNAPISITNGLEYLNDLKDVVINSNISPSSYPVVLSKANNEASTKFNNTSLNTLLQGLIIGDNGGISVSNYAASGYNNKTKISLNAATTENLGGIRIGYTQNGKNYPVALSDNKAYVNVPWTDNDHTYEGGNGITVGSSPSQSGNYPISVVLTDGGGLDFDNSGKLKISNTYGGTKYLFGNPYWQNGLPQSYGYDNSHLTDINYVTNIYLQSSSTAAATALTMRDPGATNDTNSFVIRKNSTYAEIYNRKSAEPLLVTPGSYMAVGQGNIPSTTIANYINGCMLWSNGSLVVGTSVTDTTSSITLGGAVLKWDETNKALYVQRKDGSAANFYATGGVSALGFSNGVSSIDAMTFGSLNVEGNLNIYDDYASYTIGVDHDDLLINCEDGNDIILGSDVYITGSAHITGNTIYMTNKWRFRIDNGTGGTNNCILEYNRGSSTPDWIQKDSWTAS